MRLLPLNMFLLVCLLSAFAALPPSSQAQGLQKSVITPPFAYNDAPNLMESSKGIFLYWSAGSGEGKVDVTIQQSHFDGSAWSNPRQVAHHVESRRGVQLACWNPVPVQGPNGQTALFYQVGSSRQAWKGHVMFSYDGGHSWLNERSLPKGIHGPTKNKPILMPDGRFLCPSSNEEAGWRVHLEWATPFRERWGWNKTKPLNSSTEYRATDPAVLVHDDEDIQVLCRTKQGYMAELWSHNGGKSWEAMQRGPLPNPNASFDAIRLKDGRFAMVYSHSGWKADRMNLAFSENGRDWEAAAILDQNEAHRFDHPTMIQTGDGQLHIVFSVNSQRFHHLRLDPGALKTAPIVNQIWPLQIK
ncbi:MAG: sialidase family protein [Verrucomicrobiota bacterium]|nr:sialidase family protein [Verrucomicrobiota bacterium]